MNHSKTQEIGETLYQELSKNFRVLYDDRNLRAGEKFKDSDLIGIPLRITIGEKNLEKGMVEIRIRSTKEVFLVTPEEAGERVRSLRAS